MRSKSLLPLDDDVLDRVFFFLPDFATLRSLILSAKPFLAVFQAHPNSIIRAICYNIAGPALPQAIRLLRYSQSIPAADADDGSANPFALPARPLSESAPISPITESERTTLVRRAKVVGELEILFTRRYRDRALKRKLDPFESWRFRRAMYRLMLFTETFATSLIDCQSGDEEADMEEVEKFRKRQREFLDEFTTDELQEFYTVSTFLTELVEAMIADHGGDFDDWFVGAVLACGPEEILDQYMAAEPYSLYSFLEDQPAVGGWEYDDDGTPMNEYMSHPLNAIWTERKVKPPDEANHWKSILGDDFINGPEQCQQCTLVVDRELWSENNWDTLLYTRTARDGLHMLFKGELVHNQVEKHSVLEIESKESFTYDAMMKKMFQMKLAAFDDWKEQDWICMGCIRSFISSHLHLWLLERKREENMPVPNEDCWYGYDCRTQNHKRLHAEKLNHLAEPKRK